MIFRLLRALLRGLMALPAPVKRVLAGRAVRSDGQYLDLDVQLLLRTLALTSAAVRARRNG